MTVIASFTCLCFKDMLDLQSISYHIYAIIGNYSARFSVLPASGFCGDTKSASDPSSMELLDAFLVKVNSTRQSPHNLVKYLCLSGDFLGSPGY